MYNPTTRLLTILELLQARGEMSGHDLAQSLQVEERSIRRYILRLRDIGIPIDGERGRYGGYSLRPGFRLPPMMFTAEEISAVTMGLMIIQELGATSLIATESAAARIDRVLPDELRHRTEALRESLILDDIKFGKRSGSNEIITQISLASYEKKSIEIQYQSASGDVSQRIIDPYGLVWHASACYIPAYCHLRHDKRIFRLDRVRSVNNNPQHFTVPTNFDAHSFVLTALAQLPGTFVFKVLLYAPLSTVQEIVPRSTAILNDMGENTMMCCYSDDPHWLARYLSRLELPFMVIETDELRSALCALANSLMVAAQKPNNDV